MVGYLGSDFDPFGPDSDNPSGPTSGGGDVIPATWSPFMPSASLGDGLKTILFFGSAIIAASVIFSFMSQPKKGRRRR